MVGAFGIRVGARRRTDAVADHGSVRPGERDEREMCRVRGRASQVLRAAGGIEAAHGGVLGDVVEGLAHVFGDLRDILGDGAGGGHGVGADDRVARGAQGVLVVALDGEGRRERQQDEQEDAVGQRHPASGGRRGAASGFCGAERRLHRNRHAETACAAHGHRCHALATGHPHLGLRRRYLNIRYT